MCERFPVLELKLNDLGWEIVEQLGRKRLVRK
jgi:hypothetical protein